MNRLAPKLNISLVHPGPIPIPFFFVERQSNVCKTKNLHVKRPIYFFTLRLLPKFGKAPEKARNVCDPSFSDFDFEEPDA